MNKTRRNALSKLLDELEDIRYKLADISDEEQECFDNIPENLYGSERYENAEAAVDALNSALENLDDLMCYIEEAQE